MQLYKWIILIAVLSLAIGAGYSGTVFFAHFSDAVPMYSYGNRTVTMQPGDYFEQMNRYTLVGKNLIRGNSPYYQGYQYNASLQNPPFSEGPIFFPFSFLGGLFAVLAGDIVTVNTVVLLSYPLTGVCMFLLGYQFTRNPFAALMASVLLVTLPFRTSFLYGELIYGVDLCLLPLSMFFFERFLQNRTPSSAVSFAGTTFCAMTANYQLFYFYVIFGSAYFLVGLIATFRTSWAESKKSLMALGVCSLPFLGYPLYFKHLLNTSGRHYELSDIQIYTPDWANAWTSFNGNEKNVFIGFPLLIVLITMLVFGLKSFVQASTSSNRRIWLTVGPLYVASYLFCFGTNLDHAIHIPIYKMFFNHFPAASATRTPGRIMGVAGVFFCVLFVLALDYLWRVLRETPRGRLMALPVTVLFVIAIVVQNCTASPLMAIIEKNIPIYSSLQNSPTRILALPFSPEPDNYMNTIYTYLGARYNIRMFNGHSSLFPSYMVKASQRLGDLNENGQCSEDVWKWLKQNKFGHILVHATATEPKAGPFLIANLELSKYLNLEEFTGGIYKFAILNQPRVVEDTGNAKYDNLRALMLSPGSDTPTKLLQYSDNWYSREVYPSQKPFRWMKGVTAALFVIDAGGKHLSELKFDVKCPFDNFAIEVDGTRARYLTSPAADGWKAIRLQLPTNLRHYSNITLTTSAVFSAPPDPRQFGCMVGDIEASTVDTRVTAPATRH